MKYAIHEHFYSFQGEGVHMGKAAYFLRLHGCDQHCHFCDAAGTWHPDHRPADLWRGRAGETANLIRAPHHAFVVLTGGEPALYNLSPLLAELKSLGRKVHIETAGHRPLPFEGLDWITLSPKMFARPPLRENIQRADEFKVIVESSDNDGAAIKAILPHMKPGAVIWLHPEWSKRNDPVVLNLITSLVLTVPACRAGWQLHKLYKADALDGNSRPAVPLGGQEERGASI